MSEQTNNQIELTADERQIIEAYRRGMALDARRTADASSEPEASSEAPTEARPSVARQRVSLTSSERLALAIIAKLALEQHLTTIIYEENQFVWLLKDITEAIRETMLKLDGEELRRLAQGWAE